jgi:hypothetical protein
MPRRLPTLEISPPFDRRISYETRLLLPGFRVFEGCSTNSAGDGCFDFDAHQFALPWINNSPA